MIETDRYESIFYYVVNDKKEEKQPIILHIHGAGSRGCNLMGAYRANPIVTYVQSHEDFPFKIYAPQCHADTWYELYEQLLGLARYIRKREVGADIYLTGISMGGYCAWQLLQSEPELFRKALICCGGGMYWNAARIKTPVRAFHGLLDKVVFCEESEKMVAAVKASGGTAELTVYDSLEHNVWDTVFNNKENYDWLLK